MQPDLLLLLLLLLLSVSSDRRNCLAIVFSCGKSRFYLKIMGKSHCALVGFALSKKIPLFKHFHDPKWLWLCRLWKLLSWPAGDSVSKLALAMGFSCAHFPWIRLMHKESVTGRTSEFAFDSKKPSRPFQSCYKFPKEGTQVLINDNQTSSKCITIIDRIIPAST